MHGRIKDKEQTQKKEKVRGFDKLVDTGMTLEEIEMMRS